MNKIDNIHLNNDNMMVRKITDFSIDNILGNNNSNSDSDNRNFVQKTTTSATIVRPLNKIIAGPWISSGPIFYNPEYYANILNQQKGYFLQQNLIYVNKQNFLNNNCNNNSNGLTIDTLINSSGSGSSLKNNKSQYIFYENYKSIPTNFNVNNSKSNYSSNLITKHSYSDLGESIYCCKICSKVFECSVTLEAHEKVHRTPRYECEECGKGFSQLRNYKYHLSVHRGTKEFAAECPECGKIFNDKGYLSSHLKIHRNRKEYACPHCPKSFNQRVAFNMHVRIHTGVKPHKCVECGKRFSRKMLLKQHSRTHSGEKPYQCSVCGKTFADRSNMTLHHKLHSGIKPFACPICPKAFTKKHHLKTHINYHTGCKPYVCPHPSCGQAFTQSSNMRTHAKKCQLRPIIS